MSALIHVDPKNLTPLLVWCAVAKQAAAWTRCYAATCEDICSRSWQRCLAFDAHDCIRAGLCFVNILHSSKYNNKTTDDGAQLRAVHHFFQNVWGNKSHFGGSGGTFRGRKETELDERAWKDIVNLNGWAFYNIIAWITMDYRVILPSDCSGPSHLRRRYFIIFHLWLIWAASSLHWIEPGCHRWLFSLWTCYNVLT